MVKNIIEKIWDAHVVKSESGFPDILAIDLHLLHEVTSPQAFKELRKLKIEVYAPDRSIATIDHNISTAKNRLEFPLNNQIRTLRKNCEDFGIKLLDMGSGRQGIVHVIGPELGLTQPGMTIVCGDSHTSTHGAFSALAFGIGTTEVGHVLATSCLLQMKPKTMKVHFTGYLGKNVCAKDMILKLIQIIGVSGAGGYVIEYTGDVISKMSMEERMTVCNMSIECGARAGLIAPDETTFEYIKGKTYAPGDFESAKKHWETFVSDSGARYDNIVEIDISELSPLVTWGINPEQSVEVSEEIPEPIDKLMRSALDYVNLTPGMPIRGTKIDYVFIGSCTNGRISDLREAAKIIKGRKVAENVVVYVVPGSEQVHLEARNEGLDKIFIDAGCDFRNPGCSMCLAMNEDKVPSGKRCASTSNRNFIGRQGEGSITHLMSPIMAACAAVTGEITNPNDLS